VNAIDVVDAVVYADIFDCAAREDDVWRFSRVALERGALGERLAELDGLIERRDGFVCLAGREDVLAGALERRHRAARLRRRARCVARVLQHAPFVRGLLLPARRRQARLRQGRTPTCWCSSRPGESARPSRCSGRWRA
jgi:hypothetical protein